MSGSNPHRQKQPRPERRYHPLGIQKHQSMVTGLDKETERRSGHRQGECLHNSIHRHAGRCHAFWTRQ